MLRFIDAGAEVIMTNTYHCSVQKMMDAYGFSVEEAESVIRVSGWRDTRWATNGLEFWSKSFDKSRIGVKNFGRKIGSFSNWQNTPLGLILKNVFARVLR